MKQKILFILHLPPPVHGASLAGKYIHDSLSINETFDTTYVNLMTAGSLQDAGKGRVKKAFVLFYIISAVVKAFYKRKYDLCYITLNASGPGFYKDLLIVLLVKAFGNNIIYHFHNKGVASASKSAINHFLYKVAFKKAKCILLTPLLYYDVAKYVNKKNIFYCPNGIPVNSLNPTCIERKDSHPCQLLFLSNMMEEKGVYVLLKACTILKEKYLSSFECHFVGAWSDITETAFYQEVSLHGLQECVFAHGKMYGNDKNDFYKNADVFVLPTYYQNEVFPLVILEAMQFNLPVVSTQIGGIADEVINEKTGYLLPPNNANELADKLNILIANPDIRRLMGCNGYKHFIQNFTLYEYEQNLTSIFNKAMQF